MAESLWKNLSSNHFFIIPDEIELPAGDLAIRNLIGERRKADGASLAPYEVTEKQATEWMKGKVGNLLEGVRGWLDNAVDRLTGVDDDPIGALREAADRARHLAEEILAKPPGAAQKETLTVIAGKLRKTADLLGEAGENADGGRLFPRT